MRAEPGYSCVRERWDGPLLSIRPLLRHGGQMLAYIFGVNLVCVGIIMPKTRGIVERIVSLKIVPIT